MRYTVGNSTELRPALSVNEMREDLLGTLRNDLFQPRLSFSSILEEVRNFCFVHEGRLVCFAASSRFVHSTLLGRTTVMLLLRSMF